MYTQKIKTNGFKDGQTRALNTIHTSQQTQGRWCSRVCRHRGMPVARSAPAPWKAKAQSSVLSPPSVKII